MGLPHVTNYLIGHCRDRLVIVNVNKAHTLIRGLLKILYVLCINSPLFKGVDVFRRLYGVYVW